MSGPWNEHLGEEMAQKRARLLEGLRLIRIRFDSAQAELEKSRTLRDDWIRAARAVKIPLREISEVTGLHYTTIRKIEGGSR